MATNARPSVSERSAASSGPTTPAVGYGSGHTSTRSQVAVETTELGGYPVLEHIRLILGGPVAWAPAVDGAAVVSLRGGDYELVCGQDFSIGYRSRSGAAIEL